MATKYLYRIAKIFIIRTKAIQLRTSQCCGCIEEQPNQLAHVSECGVGCLDPICELPDHIYQEAYSSVTLKEIEDLFSFLLQFVDEEEQTEYFLDDTLKSFVLADEANMYYPPELHQLCANFVAELNNTDEEAHYSESGDGEEDVDAIDR